MAAPVQKIKAEKSLREEFDDTYKKFRQVFPWAFLSKEELERIPKADVRLKLSPQEKKQMYDEKRFYDKYAQTIRNIAIDGKAMNALYQLAEEGIEDVLKRQGPEKRSERLKFDIGTEILLSFALLGAPMVDLYRALSGNEERVKEQLLELIVEKREWKDAERQHAREFGEKVERFSNALAKFHDSYIVLAKALMEKVEKDDKQSERATLAYYADSATLSEAFKDLNATTLKYAYLENAYDEVLAKCREFMASAALTTMAIPLAGTGIRAVPWKVITPVVAKNIREQAPRAGTWAKKALKEQFTKPAYILESIVFGTAANPMFLESYRHYLERGDLKSLGKVAASAVGGYIVAGPAAALIVNPIITGAAKSIKISFNLARKLPGTAGGTALLAIHLMTLSGSDERIAKKMEEAGIEIRNEASVKVLYTLMANGITDPKEVMEVLSGAGWRISMDGAERIAGKVREEFDLVTHAIAGNDPNARKELERRIKTRAK